MKSMKSLKNLKSPSKYKIISIKLKDGKEIKGQAFLTTPSMVAKGISQNLVEASVVAKVRYYNKYDSPLGKGLSIVEAED